MLRALPLRIAALLLLPLVAGCSGSRPAAPAVPLPAGLSPSEQKLWTTSAYEVERLQRSGLVNADPALTAYVQEVGMRLVPERLNVPATFRFHVVMDPDANAFALPDGNIYVHLGLLARVQREDQLAQVLGHEVRHVTGRHSAVKYDQARGIAGATQVLSVAAAIGFGAMGGGGVQFWGGVSQLGLALTASAAINGHGRAAEEDSDLYAVQAMDAEGYDLCAATELFELLLAEHGQASAATTFFYGSHPQLTKRMAYTRERAEHLHGGDLACEPAPRDSVYLARTAGVRAAQVELWVRSERFDRALEAADRALAVDSTDAYLRFWRAEALRLGPEDAASRQQAEDDYWRATELDTTYAAPYRGIGLLAEEDGDAEAAIDAYDYYLYLDPEAKDRRYIQHRIATLRGAGSDAVETESTETNESTDGE
ncbi:MAG: M48 family metallopeptidase [Rhodothermales bacterium]